MAINTGDLLMGLGAAIGGTGPQFIQGLDQRDRQRTEQKRAELQARQQAMYQDAATGLQLLSAGDLDGLIALGEDRLQLLQTYPDADPSDTQRIVQNARFAKQGDPVALRNLATELTTATSRGMSMGLVKMPEAQIIPGSSVVNGQIITQDPMGNFVAQTPEGFIPTPADRETKEDQLGVLRYTDNGEPVFPNVQAPSISPEERTSALNNVRGNLENINKSVSAVVDSYSKIVSLETQMRRGNRGARNAAIMNLARLISPGVVTNQDVAGLSGADTSIGAIFSFLDGKGVDKTQLMRIADPLGESFDVDGLLSIAGSITSAGVPSLLAQFDDQAKIADIYGASGAFKKAYLGDSKLRQQLNNIMQGIGRGSNVPSFANDQEAEAAYNAGEIKLGQTIIVGGKQAVVEE
tara:strand:- start:2297 stop:3520 length:1224 start_codon:yes stop_codon:yes gene_type:complete